MTLKSEFTHRKATNKLIALRTAYSGYRRAMEPDIEQIDVLIAASPEQWRMTTLGRRANDIRVTVERVIAGARAALPRMVSTRWIDGYRRMARGHQMLIPRDRISLIYLAGFRPKLCRGTAGLADSLLIPSL